MKKWTEDELRLLEKLYNEGKTYSQIASILGRSFVSVEKAIRRYGHILELNRQREKNYILVKKAHREELYNFIFNSFTDTILKYNFEIKPVKTLTSYSKGKKVEIANLVLSDLHIGKINKVYNPATGKTEITYNDEIRKKMMSRLLQSISEIISLLKPKYYLEKLNLYLLGDIIEGDGYVWEGQHFQISKCVGLQLWDGVFDLAFIIKELQKLFPKISVYCVIGNHSKYTSSRDASPPIENYLEYHIYRILQLLFRNNNKVNIIVPNTYDYSTKVYNHLVYMAHGDNIRGYSITTRIKKTKDIYINLPEGFDLLILGHFHTQEKYSIGDRGTLLMNGCWIPKDQYAKKLYGIYSEPKQWFFGSNKIRPMTWYYELDFRGVVR